MICFKNDFKKPFNKNLRERESITSQRNKGFTVIELLVVIAIIGLLASVVLVSLKGVEEKARDARRKKEIHQIMMVLEVYASGGQYPDTTGGSGTYSKASVKCLGFGSGETCFNGRHSGLDSLQSCFLSAVPTDPNRKNTIFDAYLYSSACHSSHLPPDGGRCIYWQPEGDISNKSCTPGIKGSSGGDVCGYLCNFCTLKIGD